MSSPTDLPDVLAIGPMKAGTTWLHEYLKSRGDICLPQGTKETFFFDRRFEKGVEWYKAHFRTCRGGSYAHRMEVAPSYFHHIQAPQRIFDTLGRIPLVVTLRDPVERSWSHYLHLRRKGYTTLPLREAVEQFPEIVEASRYASQIRRWGELFGFEHIHFLPMEQLEEDPERYVRKLCDVLNLEFTGVPNLGASYQASVAPSSTFARLGRRTADWFRSRRIYSIVNLAKRMGLQRIFFGSSGKSDKLPVLTGEERSWLYQLLERQLSELKEIMNNNLVP